MNTVDRHDLAELQPSDLVSRGYDRKIAEEVSPALLSGDYADLGNSMGLRLSVSREAARLLPTQTV